MYVRCRVSSLTPCADRKLTADEIPWTNSMLGNTCRIARSAARRAASGSSIPFTLTPRAAPASLMPTSSVPSVLLTSPIAAKMLSKGICGRGVGSEMVRAPEVERDTSSGVTTCDESSQAANIPPRTIVIEPSTNLRRML